MEISPLYQILIYLEDKRSASLDEIKNWGIAISRGVLGKMEAMGLVESTETNGKIVLKLSQRGYEFLNSILDQIHKDVVHWDGKWRMVWFSIPERERSSRDKFRRFLESLGLKPILNSLWITPLDVKEQVSKYVQKNHLTNRVLLTETEILEGMDTLEILKAWNFDKFRVLYEEFMKKVDLILSSKDSENFEKKKLIFEYASILNCEPQLPIELLPRDWPRFRAGLYYKRLRRTISNS